MLTAAAAGVCRARVDHAAAGVREPEGRKAVQCTEAMTHAHRRRTVAHGAVSSGSHASLLCLCCRHSRSGAQAERKCQ